MKEKTLLHTCCGVCAVYPAERLSAEFEVIGFWYNPNIHPYAEFQKRVMANGYVFSRLNLPVIWDLEYEIDNWLGKIREAKYSDRCRICYELRLEKTAQVARQEGINFFTTTLLVSPHQKHEIIKEIGTSIAGRYGLKFHYEDFRAGHKKGNAKSRQWQVYHQNYCGCLFSEKERFSNKR